MKKYFLKIKLEWPIKRMVIALVIGSMVFLCACQNQSSTDTPLWVEEYEEGMILLQNEDYEEALVTLKGILDNAVTYEIIGKMEIYKIYEAIGDAYYGMLHADNAMWHSTTLYIDNTIWYYSKALEENISGDIFLDVSEKLIQVFVTDVLYYDSEIISRMQRFKDNLLQLEIENDFDVKKRNDFVDDVDYILTWYQTLKSGAKKESEEYLMYPRDIPPKVDEYIEYDSYEAMGSFSEGLALVRKVSDGKLAFIDKEGNVKIDLPEEYLSATVFSNGCATISTGEKLFYDEWYFSSILSDTTVLINPSDMLEDEYALIDTEGNFIVKPGEYDFIGKTSEGKTLVYWVEETYQGTDLKMGFVDCTGNLVLKFDASPYVHIDGSQGGIEDIFYYRGTVVLPIVKSTGSSGQIIMDETGNILQEISPRDTFHYVDKDITFNSSRFDSRKDFVVYNRIMRSMENISTKDISTYIDDGYLQAQYFIDGYTMIEEGYSSFSDGNQKILFIDTTGNVVSISDELNISDIIRTEEDAWILELQNGYYGIIDHTAQLLFEPRREEILYLGEGLFYGVQSKEVFDKNGEIKFVSVGEPYSPVYGNIRSAHYLYSEGLIIASVNGVPRYMDMEGNILWESVSVTVSADNIVDSR